MQRIPLEPSNVAAIRAAGSETSYEQGALLAQVGTPADRFVHVGDGETAVLNPFKDERLAPSTLSPSQFMAEMSLPSGGIWSMPMRAAATARNGRRHAGPDRRGERPRDQARGAIRSARLGAVPLLWDRKRGGCRGGVKLRD